MAALKSCFEKQRLSRVKTYIQSGNVIFDSPETNLPKLTAEIEKFLSKQFSYKSVVVVKSLEQMRDVVDEAPSGFGVEPTKYRYMVIFVKAPLTVDEAIKSTPLKEGVDQVFAGPEVLYHIRLESRATQSHLNKIVAMSMYQNMTLRNWNTTTKLLDLMSG